MEYKEQVKLWQAYHNALPVNNSIRVPQELQGLVLKSQLFGRAKDLCAGITAEQLQSENGVDLIVQKVFKRDALSVVSETFKDFNCLLDSKRDEKEGFRNFEQRFAANMAKFNSISETTKLPECITALMLLANASVDDAQRISVLASAANHNGEVNDQASNDALLETITYESIASIIKQCDRQSEQGRTMSAHSLVPRREGTGNGNGKYNPYKRHHNHKDKTMRFPCHVCGNYGHWKRDHNKDGSLKQGVRNIKSEDIGKQQSNINDAQKTGGASSSKKTVTFSNMILLNSAQIKNMADMRLGPLVDDGATYSAIGIVELNILHSHIGNVSEVIVNPVPEKLKDFTHLQYGSGNHTSVARKIIGSTVITVYSDNNRPVEITHIVVDGSSQWVVGKNITDIADIQHRRNYAMVFDVEDGEDSINMVKHNGLSFLELEKILQTT